MVETAPMVPTAWFAKSRLLAQGELARSRSDFYAATVARALRYNDVAFINHTQREQVGDADNRSNATSSRIVSCGVGEQGCEGPASRLS